MCSNLTFFKYLKRLALFFLISSLVSVSTYSATYLSNTSVAFSPSVNLTSTKEGQNSKLQGSNSSSVSGKLIVPRGASEQGSIPFEPQILKLSAGNRITVKNLDLIPHSVTSGTGPQDNNSGQVFDSLIIQAGGSSEINTSKLSPGLYDFFCVIHPFMKGKIQVAGNSPMLTAQPPRLANTTVTNDIPLSKSDSVTSLPESNTPLVQSNNKPAPNLLINSENNPTTSALSEANLSIVKIVKGSSDPAIGQFYSPTSITVSSGSTISWANDDSTLHTVTSGIPGESSGKDFDSGYLAAGDTFQHTFNTAGNFDYWCTLHPHMTGKVIVR